jgi:peptide deformylase
MFEILEYPDPRLRRPADPVEQFDDDLRSFVAELLDTVDHADGLGLSANQVGDPRAVLVLRPAGDDAIPRVYVNPEVLDRSAHGVVQESCLSLPGISGLVLRATRVRVRARDAAGAPFECDLQDMDAVSLQHEVDHLEGTLFIDRLSIVRRVLLRLTGRTKRGA